MLASVFPSPASRKRCWISIASMWTAKVWRLCLQRHSRHYLPFPTMSFNFGSTQCSGQKSSVRSDIVLARSTRLRRTRTRKEATVNALSALRSFLLRPANVALASTFLHFQWARVRRKCAVCAPEAVSVRCRSWLASWGENYVESLARGGTRYCLQFTCKFDHPLKPLEIVRKGR